MAINPIANNAYSFVQKALNNSGATDSTGATSNFGSMVGDAIKSTVNQVKGAEQVSAAAIAGKANLADVVTAVNSADVALKSVVAIRDKVIGAYQDIMKMPI